MHKNNLQTVNRKEIHIIKQTKEKRKKERSLFYVLPTKTSSPTLLRVKMKANEA